MRRQRISSTGGDDNNTDDQNNSNNNNVVPPILNVVLMTQNIGAADPFDGPKDMDKTVVPSHIKDLWIRWQKSCAEMLKEEEKRIGSPVDVFVLHIQEIGGKGYSQPMIRFLDDTHKDCYPGAAWSSGLLMQRENDVKTFTALGSFVFLSERAVAGASFLDFRSRQYLRVVDLDGASNNNNNNSKSNNSTNSTNSNNSGSGSGDILPTTGQDPNTTASTSQQPSAICYSAKFINADTSRKGFVFVSMRIGNRVMNFLNMHLFHDADNIVAASVSPSQYVGKRRDSFVESLGETSCLVDDDDCLFVFGDLNLRLDTHELVEEFKRQGLEPRLEKKKIHAEKEFWYNLVDPSRFMWLKQFDKEVPTLFKKAMSEFNQKLYEAPVRFGPSYLVAEDDVKDVDASLVNGEDDEHLPAKRAIYQKTRFPAWCDRVFYNDHAYKQFVESPTTRDFTVRGEPRYGSANLVHMDHLSVVLRFHFKVV